MYDWSSNSPSLHTVLHQCKQDACGLFDTYTLQGQKVNSASLPAQLAAV